MLTGDVHGLGLPSFSPPLVLGFPGERLHPSVVKTIDHLQMGRSQPGPAFSSSLFLGSMRVAQSLAGRAGPLDDPMYRQCKDKGVKISVRR